MNQTYTINLSRSKIICEYYYEYYYVINFQLGLFAQFVRKIRCKAKLYYRISYNSLHEKYDKEKNSQSGSLYFLALSSPSLPSPFPRPFSPSFFPSPSSLSLTSTHDQ